jgi:hypothetical protein
MLPDLFFEKKLQLFLLKSGYTTLHPKIKENRCFLVISE